LNLVIGTGFWALAFLSDWEGVDFWPAKVAVLMVVGVCYFNKGLMLMGELCDRYPDDEL